ACTFLPAFLQLVYFNYESKRSKKSGCLFTGRIKKYINSLAFGGLKKYVLNAAVWSISTRNFCITVPPRDLLFFIAKRGIE
ncbi:MAG: hypothetical protein ACOC7U_10725, partial [Spirochaetota bacterium]